MPRRTAVILGAGGLVGRHCLETLLTSPHYERVTVLTRNPSGRRHEGLTEVKVDFDRPETYSDHLLGDDLFCCLGADLRAGRETLLAVDHTLTVALCRAAASGGMHRLILVSSAGVGERAVLWYCRMKRRTEKAVSALGFERVVILRPSLFLGRRDEPRLGEQIGKAIMCALFFVYIGPLRKYRPIQAEHVARAMVRVASKGGEPVEIVESDRIRAISLAQPTDLAASNPEAVAQ